MVPKLVVWAMPRRLDPEEAALWARVTSTVRPLNRKPVASPLSASPASPVPPAAKLLRTVQPPAHAAQPARAVLANTLDGGWDRRISAGGIKIGRATCRARVWEDG